jgi:hypothetical protein
VHESNTAKSSRCRAEATDVRKKDLRGIADDDGLDVAGTRDEYPHLAARRVRRFCEVFREFVRGDLLRRDATAIESIERA